MGKQTVIPGCFGPTERCTVSLNRMLVGGKSGSGKGHFALLTDAPGDIGMIPMDENAYAIFAKAQKEGRPVHMPKYDFLRVGDKPNAVMKLNQNRTDAETLACKQAASKFLEPVLEAVAKFGSHPSISTIVIDGVAKLWADVVTAHWGRPNQIMPIQRTGPNTTMESIFNACGNKNLIITTRVKPIWSGEGNNAKPIPGRWEAVDAWPNLDYVVSTCLLMGRIAGKQDVDDLKMGWVSKKTDEYTTAKFNGLSKGDYWAIISKNNTNPMLIGAETLLVNDEITYSTVAAMTSDE